MDKTPPGLAQDNGRIPNDSTSAPSKGKRGRKGSQSIESKRYPLRSTHSSARVLRSTSENESKTPNEPVSPLRSALSSARVLRSTPDNKRKTPKKPVKPQSARVLRSTLKNSKEPNEPVNDNTAVQPTAKKRKRGRPSSAASPKKRKRGRPSSAATPKKRKRGRPSSAASPKNENECIKIRQRVRYILNRMNYEQSLIQAYASEGWKGQSSEKIRPEKELERAKAEILRCKLRIREAFRNMDSLLSEGKIDESLFDSKGELSSEDIFCAICGSKHVTMKNDIILCDGACDRGFHQKCLNPPLLAEDIPPDDEGWLCPACDCKLDCIDVLNELQGSTLAIHDSWEKVFPESASLANGAKQIGSSDLPSDDSEDNDYDPTLAEGNMVDEKKSSAEDGDEGSDSDDLDFMTSSDDSEPSTKKRSKSMNKNTVDDLGFPSEDSEDDDFDPEGPNSSEDQKTKANSEESDFTSDSDDFCAEISKSCGQGEVMAPSFSDQTDGVEIMEAELEQDLVLPVSSRRQVRRLDYKTLYDDAYGKETSDPSDEEEWSGSTLPKGNLEDSDSDSFDGSLQPAKTRSKRARGGQRNDEHTPRSEQHTEVLHSNGSSSTGRKKHFGPIVSQKLKAHIEKDPYPSRSTKESLAQDLGLTVLQVTKWFASTRHYSRAAAAKKEKHRENHTAENNVRMAEDSLQQILIEPNGRVLKKPTVDGNDNVSEDRLAQDNPDEGKKEDTPFRQDISCEQKLVVTPTVNQNRTTNTREVGSPDGVLGGNQYSGNSRNAEDTPSRQDVDLNQTVPLTPVNQKRTPDTSSVGSPGVSGGNQRHGTPRNVGSPRSRSAEKSIPGLEHVDEARRKAILRELRKMKTGR